MLITTASGKKRRFYPIVLFFDRKKRHFWFVIKQTNGKKLLTSETYTMRLGASNGIRSALMAIKSEYRHYPEFQLYEEGILKFSVVKEKKK